MKVNPVQVSKLVDRRRSCRFARLSWATAVLMLIAVVPGCGGKSSAVAEDADETQSSEGGKPYQFERSIGGGLVGATPSRAVYGEQANDVRVVVVVDQAEIRDEAGVAEKLGLGIVLTPRREEGGRFRVRHSRRVGWIAKDQTIPIAEAMSHFTRMISANPQDAKCLVARGLVHMSLGRNELAVIDFDDAIALDPKLVRAYHNRGLASPLWESQTYHRKAIEIDPQYAVAYINLGNSIFGWNGDVKHLLRAAELDPDCFWAYYVLAKYYESRKDYDAFGEAVNQMIRLDPEDAEALNQRAWFMATCSQAKHRNGHQAVADATKACDAEDWNEPNYIDTLAAAYAEVGDFRAAVQRQSQAIEALDDDDLRLDGFQRRLELYRAGGPYRE